MCFRSRPVSLLFLDPEPCICCTRCVFVHDPPPPAWELKPVFTLTHTWQVASSLVTCDAGIVNLTSISIPRTGSSQNRKLWYRKWMIDVAPPRGGCLQEPADADGGGEARARPEDEEDGGRDGAGVRDEGQREEDEAQGLRKRCEYHRCCYTLRVTSNIARVTWRVCVCDLSGLFSWNCIHTN